MAKASLIQPLASLTKALATKAPVTSVKLKIVVSEIVDPSVKMVLSSGVSPLGINKNSYGILPPPPATRSSNCAASLQLDPLEKAISNGPIAGSVPIVKLAVPLHSLVGSAGLILKIWLPAGKPVRVPENTSVGAGLGGTVIVCGLIEESTLPSVLIISAM